MNKREQMLAVAIGVLLVVIGCVYGLMALSSAYSARQTAINKLKQEISDKERRLRFARRATQRLNAYREMSLPEDHELAGSLYQTWFLNHLEKVGMTNVKISTTGGRARSKTQHAHSFTVTANGNLGQLTRLLYQFYSADHLHRLRQCKIEPTKEAKKLNLSFAIDALSIQKADHEETLNAAVANRLAHEELAEYERVIVGRNIFGPPNKPPKITSSSSQRGAPNSPLTFTVKASDPDSADVVSYQLDGATLPDAKFDGKSGEFRWTPTSKGDFEVAVIATDNGLPPKSDRQVIKLTVADPPPVPPPPKKKLEFDNAKHTYLTAITGREGEPVVAWLSIRPTGETLKLHEGDKLDIGSIQGRIKTVRDNTAEIETEEKRIVLRIGDPLLPPDTTAN